MVRAPLVDFEQDWADRLAFAAEHEPDAFRGRRFDAQGALVDLGATRHARRLDLQIDAAAFDMIYQDGDREVGRQTVMAAPLRLGDDIYTVVRVPEAVAQAGYNQIRLVPRLAGDYVLRRVGLFDEVTAKAPDDPGAASDHVADLLRQFYHAFYRSPRDERADRLTELLARIRSAPADEWATLPAGYPIDLLRMPAPELHDLLLERLPALPVLADAEGNGMLRFLGFLPEPPAATDEEAVLRGRLVFEVLAPFTEDYTLWFHLANTETGAEFMVYDYPEAEETTRWPTGAIYEVPVVLALEPGDYDASFGLWTPDRRRLYVDKANDVYWINLGLLDERGPACEAVMPESGTPTQGRRGPIVLLTSLVFALVVLKTAWLADDALITLRVAANWLQGFGPVWNVGERVQVYTHPLWLLVLAAATGVTQEFYFTTLAVSLALALATFVLVVGKIAVDPISAAFGAALLILGKGFVDYSTSGLENVLTHLLLAVFLALYVAAPRTLGRAFWLAVVAALGAVNRLDTLLLYAPALIYTVVTLRGARLRALLVMAAGFVPLVLWEAFALLYYGFPFPNTYYAKLYTGIPQAEMVQQGLLYLLHSFGLEPLTVVTIGAGLVVPWLRRDWRLAAVAAGIFLYLLYVVRIGGDFMSGRYLTAPFLAAVVILVRQPLATLKAPAVVALFAAALLLGFANPAHAPWFSAPGYDFTETDNKGIEDERGYYYQRYGLLPASRTNRLAVGGRISGVPDPQNRVETMMGIVGLTASPYTQIVDILALTDPLLARLPAVHIPQWVHGHFFRRIPDGYLGTLRTGRNRIVDPQVADLYDRLALVTQGPLFAPARWAEIWRFNTGQNDGLVDPVAWRYPELQTRPWQDFDRNWPEHLAYVAAHGTEAPRGVALDSFGGVRVDLGELRHERLVDLGFGASRFEVVYLDGDVEVGRQTISQSPLRLGEDLFTLVEVPADVAARGYSELLILPLLAEPLRLERVGLFDGAGKDQSGIGPSRPIHLADLLRQYFFTFYRAEPGDRDARLTALLERIQAAPAEEWDAVPGGYKIDLLKMPAPPIQQLVAAHSPGGAHAERRRGSAPAALLGLRARPAGRGGRAERRPRPPRLRGAGAVCRGLCALVSPCEHGDRRRVHGVRPDGGARHHALAQRRRVRGAGLPRARAWEIRRVVRPVDAGSAPALCGPGAGRLLDQPAGAGGQQGQGFIPRC